MKYGEKYREEYRMYLEDKCVELNGHMNISGTNLITNTISTVLSDIKHGLLEDAGPLFHILYNKMQEKCKIYSLTVISYDQFASEKREDQLKKLGI